MVSPTLPRRRFLWAAAGTGLAAPLSLRAAAPAGHRAAGLTVRDVQILEVSDRERRRARYLQILTDGGVEGLYGPIDGEAALMVERFFKRPLIGRDPLAIEAFWNAMWHANRHSRGSHYLIGLSAVDNALWDLRGRALGLPVYRLLGGGDRRRVRVYASCLGFPLEPAPLQAKARELQGQGFQHQKWFLRDRGPQDGPAGLTRNVEIVRLLRAAVGDDTDLMFDAFWQWDLPYALAWARRAEPYRPRWIEEPVPSAEIDAFVTLSRSTAIPVATGEHFYGRWDVHNFLSRDAIRVVQADPEWCGGVSELVKICTLASVHGAHVIPHGHSIHAALHVVASQPVTVCPLVEYLLQKMRTYYRFEQHPPLPENGELLLPDRPGFGIAFNEAVVADRRVVEAV